jgi:hypothetical protein
MVALWTLTCNNFATVFSFTHILEFDKHGNDDDDDGDYDDDDCDDGNI